MYRAKAVEVTRAAGLPVDYCDPPGGSDGHVAGAGWETALPWVETDFA